jgi:hypothetical protein
MTPLLTISASSMTLVGSVGSMFLSMDSKVGWLWMIVERLLD